MKKAMVEKMDAAKSRSAARLAAAKAAPAAERNPARSVTSVTIPLLVDRETPGTYRVACEWKERPVTFYVPKGMLEQAGITGAPANSTLQISQGRVILTVA